MKPDPRVASAESRVVAGQHDNEGPRPPKVRGNRERNNRRAATLAYTNTALPLLRFAFAVSDDVKPQSASVAEVIGVMSDSLSFLDPERSVTDPAPTSHKAAPGVALQPVSVEPCVDSFSYSSPSRLEHHVVTHVGEEFCFGAICACRCAYFFRGDRAVIEGP